jgi:hypothetical protein
MVVRVVADAVPLSHHTLIEFGIFPDVITHHEERSLDTVFLQYVEHERRSLWYRTVVEGQIDSLFSTIHAPKSLWI